MSSAPVPPQNLDAEEYVLGAVMLSPNVITAVADEVRPDEFYKESNGMILQAALDLDARGEPVDAITLADELGRNGLLERVGGKDRLHELASVVPAASNAPHHARIVRGAARRRDLIRVGDEIAALGWKGEGEATDLISHAERKMMNLDAATYGRDTAALGEAVGDLYAEVALAVETQTPITGLLTGFHDFDRLTTGLYPGQMPVIAARPGVGKSVLALNVAENVADRGTPAAIFSYEMSRREIAFRSVVRKTKLDFNKLRTGRLSREELAQFQGALIDLKNRPLFIEDDPTVGVAEIRSRARRLKAKHDLGLIVVDYLQLMVSGASADSRQNEVAQISRSLKLLAMELQIPVIAVSQLSRKTEGREDRRPQLADLRDSGAIEQDADIVAFLYREEMYRPVEPEKAGETELIVAKNRMGALDTVKLLFLGRRQEFVTPVRETPGRAAA